MKRILLAGAAMIYTSIFTTSTAHSAQCNTVSLTSNGSNMSMSSTSGPALCSVTQDIGYTTTIQMGGSNNVARPTSALSDKLSGVKLGTGIDTALTMASMNPPEQWTESQFVDVVTVLFALSERREKMPGIRAFLENHSDALYRAFANPANHEHAERLKLQPFTTSASYGCLELFRDTTYRSMIRLPISGSQKQCNDF